jgi:UPF0716 family protein affecting phage T7 exclusion
MVIIRKIPGVLVLLLPILWIILEFAAFGLVADWIGLFPALVLLVAKSGLALVGFGVLTRYSLATVRSMARDGFRGGRLTGAVAGDLMLGILGALLLVLPGFVAGAVGLVLLLPWVRRGLSSKFAPPASPPGVVDLDADDWRERPEQPREQLPRH